jgi:hypothetical protein
VSETWSIDEEARRLCGCLLCRSDVYRNVYPDPGLKSCARIRFAAGIRAGLKKAAEVATKIGPMNQSDSLDAAARIRALLGAR